MIMLTTPVRKLQLLLGGAVTTTQLPWTAAYNDLAASGTPYFEPGSTNGITNDGTAVDMIAAPNPGVFRQVKFLTIRNSDTVVAAVTIRYNDGGTTRILCTITLNIGDTLEYTDGHGFKVIDKDGYIKTTSLSTALITVREVDLAPSYSSISTIELDQADGFVITNPSAGVARVDFTGGGGSGSLLPAWMF